MAKPLIFVVGLPRSGTSAFARWLVANGLKTVSDRRRSDSYPDGYLEWLPALVVHKGFERAVGRADHAVSLQPFLSSELLRDRGLAALFDCAMEPVMRSKVDFFKLPQLALSIPLLAERFPDAMFVGLWREPAASFRSLLRREFPREMWPAAPLKAIWLWGVYAHHLVSAKQRFGDRVLLISIERFLKGRPTAAELLNKLGRSNLAPVPPCEVIRGGIAATRIPLRWNFLYQLSRLSAVALGLVLRDPYRVVSAVGRWRSRLSQLSE